MLLRLRQQLGAAVQRECCSLLMGEAEAAAVAVYRLRSMLKGFGTDRSFWKLKISAGCLKVPDVSLPKVVDTAQYRSCAPAKQSSDMGSFIFLWSHGANSVPGTSCKRLPGHGVNLRDWILPLLRQSWAVCKPMTPLQRPPPANPVTAILIVCLTDYNLDVITRYRIPGVWCNCLWLPHRILPQAMNTM